MDDAVVIIADDHPMVRVALREAVGNVLPKARFCECSTFDGLAQLLGAERDIDLLLLDLNMPGMQGFVGLLSVGANWPLVPVAMVSATEDIGVVTRARECGASGFIPKSAPMEVIGEAVKSVVAGGHWFPPPSSSQPFGRTAPDQGQAMELARRMATLTPQQLRVLQMLLEGRLNKQIAGDLGLAEQTIKGHVSAILRKLDVDNRTQVVIAISPLLGKDLASPQEL